MATISDRTRTLKQRQARLAEQQALLKEKERSARNREIFALGGLVRKTRLPELEHAALYGALLTLEADALNPVVVAKWTRLGERKLVEDQAADDVGKEPILIKFAAFPGKQCAARMKEAGLRQLKGLFWWQGQSEPPAAEAIARDHGGTTEYPARSVPDLREAAE